jgi:hypothetical protein
MVQCTAKSKQSGERCRRAPCKGRSVCYMHGGTQPRGMARSTTRTGRYSKDMPTRMAARYAEAQQDPELLVLRDEIALLDSRLADVLARVDTGESGALWSQLSKSWDDFMAARAGGNVAKMTEALASHQAMLERGRADYAAWAEIGTLLDRRQRFVESERRRYVEMSQMVSLEQAMLFLGAVTDAIRRHVTDQATRAALGRELELLADLPGRALATVRRSTG